MGLLTAYCLVLSDVFDVDQENDFNASWFNHKKKLKKKERQRKKY